MRPVRFSRMLVPIAAFALVLAACNGNDDGDNDTPDADDVDVDPDAIDVPEDGPDITISSFDFPESTILAEVYGQAMEAAGYPVERQLNVGPRELLYPELEEGGVDLLPEYLGSALVVGFGGEPPEDVDAGVSALSDEFSGIGVTVLASTPAENTNVFVVLTDFAEENGLGSVGDLSEAGDITLAGPPECESRDTCFVGLQDVYGLDNIGFSSIGEASARLVALTEGDAEVILLFSTDAVLADQALTALEDTEGMIPPENIVPVLRTEIVDFYGDDLVSLLDSVGEALTTEVLIGFNERANEGVAPEQIASDFLDEIGITG
jgi:osmoprotectant transport system substrate-binding protein